MTAGFREDMESEKGAMDSYTIAMDLGEVGYV